MSQPSSPGAAFDWPLALAGETLLRQRLAAFLTHNSFAAELSARMQAATGTDFFEWVDHLVLSPDDETALVHAGFVSDRLVTGPRGESVLEHPRATLPRVLLRPGRANPSVVAIKPEFVADFVAAHHLNPLIEGEIKGRRTRGHPAHRRAVSHPPALLRQRHPGLLGGPQSPAPRLATRRP